MTPASYLIGGDLVARRIPLYRTGQMAAYKRDPQWCFTEREYSAWPVWAFRLS